MKKILLTNNSLTINDNYEIIYSDSPYIVEKNNNVNYLDTLLDRDFDKKIKNIRKKGFLINDKIIKTFFSNFHGRNVKLIDIVRDYTNIYINLSKLFALIKLYPNDEITIAITLDELRNENSDRVIGKFENVYFWIAKLLKIKNIKFVCENFKLSDPDPKHKPINSWFLRLIDLDKNVLLFNLRKKLGLIKNQKKKIYIYNQNTVIREIEPYLYEKGISYSYIPEINFNDYKSDDLFDDDKLKEILDKSFENNFDENNFKIVIFTIYKKLISQYLQKKSFTEKFILNLDKSISVVLTNAFESTFASLIFAKQLQEKNFKTIEVFHGLTKGFLTESNIKIYESDIVDMVLCHSKAEKKVFKKYDQTSNVHSISTLQETKKIRLRKLQRFYVRKMLKIPEKKRVLYPSIIYPYNNANEYGERPNDKENYNFEKKIITLLSKINKNSIYKTYPNRCFIDPNTLVEYAKNLNNIKVISDRYDLRYVSSIGDIFILAPFAGSSTVMWLLGLNKPIIYLNNPKFQSFNYDALNVIKKIFISVDLDKDNWDNNLINLLNKPYEEIKKMWKAKQVYRDQYDEEWLLGNKLHAGRLGAKYIENFMVEN
jgi:hypothetical protein